MKYLDLFENTSNDKNFRLEANNIFNLMIDYINNIRDDIFSHKMKKNEIILDMSFLNKNYNDLSIIIAPGSLSGKLTRMAEFYILELGILNPKKDNKDMTKEEIINLLKNLKNIFIHEIIHYLDFKRQKNKKTFSNIDSTLKDYFNSPEEYNAYFQELIDSLEDSIRNFRKTNPKFVNNLKRFGFDKFKNWFFEKWITLLPKYEEGILTPKYKEKFIKRLYQYFKSDWQELLSENATSGATGAGSIATAVGGLGAGFDPDGMYKSIYYNSNKKPKKQKKKMLIIKRMM